MQHSHKNLKALNKLVWLRSHLSDTGKVEWQQRIFAPLFESQVEALINTLQFHLAVQTLYICKPPDDNGRYKPFTGRVLYQIGTRQTRPKDFVLKRTLENDGKDSFGVVYVKLAFH